MVSEVSLEGFEVGRYRVLFDMVNEQVCPWARAVPPSAPSTRATVREVAFLPNFLFALYAATGLQARSLLTVESFLDPVDVFHSVNAIALPQCKGRRILTIHDLTCLHFPQYHPWLRVKLFEMGVRRSTQGEGDPRGV